MNTEPLIIESKSIEQPTDFNKRFAHFLTRTNVKYSSAPYNILADRGIENRLLDNLIEYLPDGAIIAGGIYDGYFIRRKGFEGH